MRIAVVVAFALLFGGCGAAEPVAVPDVVGMPADEARDVLEAAGFESELEADGWVVMESNWTVDSQSPKAGTMSGDGSTVVAKISKHEAAEESEEPEATEEPESTPPPAPTIDPTNETPSGLSFGWAMTTCDQFGQDASPYGWNADFLMDGTHQVLGDTMFLQAGVSITNAYGTEGRFTVECSVSGSDEAPVIDSFNVD